MFRHAYIWMLLGLCLLAGCSRHDLQEAQRVVAEADSLWLQGGMYRDSVSLAQAYETLRKKSQFSIFNSPLSADYAHACYHYGKLLREKEDPVTAMQVFINATRSHTHDFHMLGRVYSNMGDICHLAGVFPLAYEMYRQSGEWYLRNSDTLLYYYDLNNMAFELAEQGKKDSTILLLDKIEKDCNDEEVLAKIWETKALLYRNTGQYDSVVYAVNYLQSQRRCHPTGLVLKAYALWYLGQRDSALYYAKYVIDMPDASGQDQYNMFYILMKSGDAAHTEEIKSISERRADLQTKILIPQHKRNAVATNILQQDLARKPNWAWLYAIITTLLIGGACIWIYVQIKRNKRQLLVQQINELKQTTSSVQEKHKELTECYAANYKRIKEDIVCKCTLLRNHRNLKTELSWADYEQMCSIVNKQFYLLAAKLRAKQCLNEKEVRLCVLTLIGLHRMELADILPYAVNSVGKLKDNTAKKLGTTGKNLHDFLLNLAIEG